MCEIITKYVKYYVVRNLWTNYCIDIKEIIIHPLKRQHCNKRGTLNSQLLLFFYSIFKYRKIF